LRASFRDEPSVITIKLHIICGLAFAVLGVLVWLGRRRTLARDRKTASELSALANTLEERVAELSQTNAQLGPAPGP